MSQLPRWLYRVAQRLAAQRSPPSRTLPLELLQLDIEQLAAVAQKARRASSIGWRGAVRRLHDQLRQHLRQVERTVTGLRTVESLPLSHGELLAELVAITKDFDDVEFLPRPDLLCAVTPPVELENVELGRFRIELELGRLPQTNCLRVLALDPNPADSDSSVTHPHVRYQRLCAGDGDAPLRRALEQRRLYDACVLVRQILQSYGPDSAYVTLDRWHGSSCEDCGSYLPAEESTYCQACESNVCFDCSSCCERCHSSFCCGCLSDCPSCGHTTCHNCQEACAGCRREVCLDCRHPQDCELCHEQEESVPTSEITENVTADAAV